MKKFLPLVAALCLCLALGGCAPESEPVEEEIDEKENDIALSMTYPKSFDGMNYMVAENWQEKIIETQITYYTDYNTMIISSTTEEDFESLFEQMLESENYALEAGTPEEPEATFEEPEGSEEETGLEGDLGNSDEALEEEIEIDGFPGIKRTVRANGQTIELFAIFVGDKTYGIAAAFDDVSGQGKSYEAVDTLLSSIRFDLDPELEAQRMENQFGEDQEGNAEEGPEAGEEETA